MTNGQIQADRIVKEGLYVYFPNERDRELGVAQEFSQDLGSLNDALPGDLLSCKFTRRSDEKPIVYGMFFYVESIEPYASGNVPQGRAYSSHGPSKRFTSLSHCCDDFQSLCRVAPSLVVKIIRFYKQQNKNRRER